MFARGFNQYGQLGAGNFQASEDFQFVETLQNVKIKNIFAGARSCFALVASDSIATQFIS